METVSEPQPMPAPADAVPATPTLEEAPAPSAASAPVVIDVRNLGVKKAPFVVLIGAGMPSVLAEVSFLTNKPELQLLKSASYKQRIAEALHAAVMRYRRSLKGQGTIAAH